MLAKASGQLLRLAATIQAFKTAYNFLDEYGQVNKTGFDADTATQVNFLLKDNDNARDFLLVERSTLEKAYELIEYFCFQKLIFCGFITKLEMQKADLKILQDLELEDIALSFEQELAQKIILLKGHQHIKCDLSKQIRKLRGVDINKDHVTLALTLLVNAKIGKLEKKSLSTKETVFFVKTEPENIENNQKLQLELMLLQITVTQYKNAYEEGKNIKF